MGTKPILLIIDGPDKVGKDTIILARAKSDNHKHVCMNRGPVGFKAYSILHNKDVKPYEYDELEASLLKVPHLMVMLTAYEETIDERLKRYQEEPPVGGVAKNLEVFKECYDKSVLNKMIINTSNFNVEECVRLINSRIELLSGDEE